MIALLCLASAAAGRRQETPPPPTPPAAGEIAILSPTGSQVLQGVVELVIQTNAPGLLHTELAFAYQGDPTGTWFLLYESNQPSERVTVEWDTGAITDGNYTLLLTAALENGGFQSMRIENLRVRNYSPVETSTPPPPAANTQPAPSATPQAENLPAASAVAVTPTLTPQPTATSTPQAAPALPTPRPNPAAIAPQQVSGSILRGGIAALGIFALAGVYWSIKRLGKRR